MSIVKFGQALPRVEDRKLLTGGGCYVDDIDLPGQAHGVIVYSSHARARIKSIDTTRALQSPGALASSPAAISLIAALAACRRFSCLKTLEARLPIERYAPCLRTTRFDTSATAWRFA